MNHYRPPLALVYISGYLKHHGIDCRVVDITLNDQIRSDWFRANKDDCFRKVAEEIVRRVVAEECDILGVTCYSPEYQEVIRLVEMIKVRKPALKIVVGGVHPTLYPEHFVYEGSLFDFAVVGEGEQALLGLVRALRSGTDSWRGVPGTCCLAADGKTMVVNPPAKVVDELDDLVHPDYSDLDMVYYTTASPYSIRGVYVRGFYVTSSRGCPSSCTFCVSRRLRDYLGGGKAARLRSPQAIFSEIKNLREQHAIDSFYFIDDLFTLKKSHVLEFCRLLLESGMNLVWGCSSKVNTVDEEMLMVMRKSGCLQIDFGVEKGSDEALASLKKGIRVEQVRKTFALCRRMGIRTFANMLVNTPGETEADLRDSLALLDEIKPTVVSFNIFTPYPGCEIFEEVGGNITREDYPILMESPVELIKRDPSKFKFSSHNVDLGEWIVENMRRYNKTFENALTFVDGSYLRCLLTSRQKMDYALQLRDLFREYVNQKLRR